MIIDFYEMCKRIKGDIMPSDERKKTIEQKVNSIISQYKIGEAGFDITKFLINCEGFEVGLQYMDDDTTGMLIVDDNNYLPNTNTHRLIIINETLKIQNDFLRRKRFIIAHEYGHYILHKNNEVQFAHRDTSKKDNPKEKEADFFARCLLMPKKLITELMSLSMFNSMNIEQKTEFISNAFNVTTKKAYQRLFELGYISN